MSVDEPNRDDDYESSVEQPEPDESFDVTGEIVRGMARVHAANMEMVEYAEDGDHPRCKPVLGASTCERCGRDVRGTKVACPSVPVSKRWKINFPERVKP